MATALKNIPFNNYVPTVDSSGAMYEMKLRRNPPCGCGACENPGYIQFVDTTCYCGCGGERRYCYGTVTLTDDECYKYMVEHAYSLVDPEGCLGMGLPVRITTNPKIQGTQYADHTIAFVDIGYCSCGSYKPFAVSEAVTLRNLPCGCGSSYCWTLGYDIYSCGSDFIDFKASKCGQCSQSSYYSYPVKVATQLAEYCSDYCFYGCHSIGFNYCTDPFDMITFKSVCGELPVRYAYLLTDECGRYSRKISYSDLTSNPGDYCIVAFSNCY